MFGLFCVVFVFADVVWASTVSNEVIGSKIENAVCSCSQRSSVYVDQNFDKVNNSFFSIEEKTMNSSDKELTKTTVVHQDDTNTDVKKVVELLEDIYLFEEARKSESAVCFRKALDNLAAHSPRDGSNSKCFDDVGGCLLETLNTCFCDSNPFYLLGAFDALKKVLASMRLLRTLGFQGELEDLLSPSLMAIECMSSSSTRSGSDSPTDSSDYSTYASRVASSVAATYAESFMSQNSVASQSHLSIMSPQAEEQSGGWSMMSPNTAANYLLLVDSSASYRDSSAEAYGDTSVSQRHSPLSDMFTSRSSRRSSSCGAMITGQNDPFDVLTASSSRRVSSCMEIVGQNNSVKMFTPSSSRRSSGLPIGYLPIFEPSVSYPNQVHSSSENNQFRPSVILKYKAENGSARDMEYQLRSSLFSTF